jgi:Zn-dependent protease with chaperone function
MPFVARYFDGRNSLARVVQVDSADVALHLTEDGGTALQIPWSQVRVGDRCPGAERVIYLAGAGELHCADHGAVDALAVHLGQGRLAAGLFRMESRTGMALAALLLSIAAAWFGLRHGLPMLVQGAADLVPPRIEVALGEQSLAALDRWVFHPSTLPLARQKVLRQRLQTLCGASSCPDWQLLFRRGGAIGANALALPGGTLVFTDELVQLARHDDELMAVAAHELGHVQERHALRHGLASAGVAVLGQIVVGDLGGIGELAGGLPALLLQTGYSREMEREADDHALTFLRRNCVPSQRFAEILARLEGEKPGASTASALFSTHPRTRERIKLFQVTKLVESGC